jgi:hypothetical protein
MFSSGNWLVLIFGVAFLPEYLTGYDSTVLPLENSITFTIIKRFVSVFVILGISHDSLFSNGERVISTFDDNDLTNNGCNASEKWAMVVHGWTESIDIHWLQDTISNLTVYRGGCLMIMDYQNHSKGDYFILVSKFFKIAEVLVKKLYQFRNEGFDFDLGYMFGFSFGGSKWFFNYFIEIWFFNFGF